MSKRVNWIWLGTILLAASAAAAQVAPQSCPDVSTGVLNAACFAGADPSVQINAAISAAVAYCSTTACGVTINAKAFNGTYTMSQMINVGKPNAPTGPGIVLSLPSGGVWMWGLTDGVSCGIRQYTGSVIRGDEGAAGSGQLWLETLNPATNMGAIYCTDPNQVNLVGSGYYRASGFNVSDANGGTLIHGAVHIEQVWDESLFENIAVETAFNDAWHVDGACCGTLLQRIQGLSNATGGGLPLKVGRGYVLLNATTTVGSAQVTAPAASLTSEYVGQNVLGPGIAPGTTVAGVASRNSLTLSLPATVTANGSTLTIKPSAADQPDIVRDLSIENSTFNTALNGLPNILVTGQYETTGVTFLSDYAESTCTAPIVYLDDNVRAAYFITDAFIPKGLNCTQFAIESHDTMPWGVIGITTNTGINDVADHVVVPVIGTPPYAAISYYFNLQPASSVTLGGTNTTASAINNLIGYTPAQAGDNSNITMLSGLTTPLDPSEGGTGYYRTSVPYTPGSTTVDVSGCGPLCSIHIVNYFPTSITNFINVTVAPTLLLDFEDANTRITRDNAVLDGGREFVSEQYSTLMLKYNAGVWFQFGKASANR